MEQPSGTTVHRRGLVVEEVDDCVEEFEETQDPVSIHVGISISTVDEDVRSPVGSVYSTSLLSVYIRGRKRSSNTNQGRKQEQVERKG